MYTHTYICIYIYICVLHIYIYVCVYVCVCVCVCRAAHPTFSPGYVLSRYRGMRNVSLPEDFRTTGGTEFAPLSTSSDLHVALHYSDGAEARLLFKLTTSSFLERGADLQFLSAFPGEVEFLYPPLTFLDPTGKPYDI